MLARNLTNCSLSTNTCEE